MLDDAADRAMTRASNEQVLQVRAEVERRIGDATQAAVAAHVQQFATTTTMQAIEDANVAGIVADRLDRELDPEVLTARVNESVQTILPSTVAAQMELWVKADLIKTVNSAIADRRTSHIQALTAAEKKSTTNIQNASAKALSSATRTAVAALKDATTKHGATLQTAVEAGRKTIAADTDRATALLEEMHKEILKDKAELANLLGSPTPTHKLVDFDTTPAKQDFDAHAIQQYNTIVDLGEEVRADFISIRDEFQALRSQSQPIVDRLDERINTVRVETDLRLNTAYTRLDAAENRLQAHHIRLETHDTKLRSASGAPDDGGGGDDDNDDDDTTMVGAMTMTAVAIPTGTTVGMATAGTPIAGTTTAGIGTTTAVLQRTTLMQRRSMKLSPMPTRIVHSSRTDSSNMSKPVSILRIRP